jgi:hypothetical protein
MHCDRSVIRAPALIVLIQLMLIGFLYLSAEAGSGTLRVRYRGLPYPLLVELVLRHAIWLVVFALLWFAYAHTARIVFKEARWRTYLPTALGLLYSLLLFVLIFGTIWLCLYHYGPSTLSD